ncbi:MAG TPA: M20/M25/M40 family metallo-hydrolase [Solirubrobacteraceae bacterium]|jgi:acetylornithine deacetylase/succinyl-diaminopimelate desuccinylase-like protein|nr:M20/M25/M40 family metallo-hydrolase [Solirubrobacteraceae bacterium]
MTEPAALLQQLIRFDTSNPPGRERECIEFVANLLRDSGIEDVRVLGDDPERPNVVARVPGEGAAPPLLLQGHVDVVPTAGQRWTHPPFDGAIVDGEVWGRGALDMKGGVAMMLSAVLRRPRTAGDVILAFVADEEAGGRAGARFLVERHPELFSEVRYSLGEFGGFSRDVAGRRFYPIAVAEKQMCALRATVRGPGGHGSLPMRGGTAARLAALLRALDRGRLPVHVTDVARRSVGAMADALPRPAAASLRALLNPRLTDPVLRVLGDAGRTFEPALRNTVNATVVRAGGALNVVPGEATVDLDGRLLPGHRSEDLLREVHAVVGDDVELEVTRYEPAPTADVDYGLFDLLAGALREADPSGTPIPLLLPGITDGRLFARLGIQHYGFVPLRLPKELRFDELIHAADERVPIEALEFGTRAIGTVLERYGR